MRRRTRIPSLLLSLVVLVLGPPWARAQWSGPITEPLWAMPGGGGVVTGGAYTLSGAAGQPADAVLTGGTYQLTGGYWSPVAGGASTATPEPELPRVFAFAMPAPNPFTTATVLRFDLPAPSHVSAEVFDLRGERVRTLADETRPAGVHHLVWDALDAGGRPVHSGVYFVRVRAGSSSATQRVVHID